jgi:hypothetical protein
MADLPTDIATNDPDHAGIHNATNAGVNARLPVATEATTVEVPNVYGGEGEVMTVVKFPSDQPAFGFILEGDEFPRIVFMPDPHDAIFYVGDGTTDPFDANAYMGFGGSGLEVNSTQGVLLKNGNTGGYVHVLSDGGIEIVGKAADVLVGSEGGNLLLEANAGHTVILRSNGSPNREFGLNASGQIETTTEWNGDLSFANVGDAVVFGTSDFVYRLTVEDGGLLKLIEPMSGDEQVFGLVRGRFHDVPSAGTFQTIPELKTATVTRLVLDDDCEITFPNPSPSGGRFTLIVQQDEIGGRTITWDTGTLWAGGVEPTLSSSPGAIDILEFVSLDPTWCGSAVGQAYA